MIAVCLAAAVDTLLTIVTEASSIVLLASTIQRT